MKVEVYMVSAIVCFNLHAGIDATGTLDHATLSAVHYATIVSKPTMESALCQYLCLCPVLRISLSVSYPTLLLPGSLISSWLISICPLPSLSLIHI